MRSGEMATIVTSMRDDWAAVTRPGNSQTSSLMGAVHHKIVDMGTIIRAKFRADNLHITGTQRLDGMQKVVEAIQTLTKSVELQGDSVDKLFERLKEIRLNVTDVHEAVSSPKKIDYGSFIKLGSSPTTNSIRFINT